MSLGSTLFSTMSDVANSAAISQLCYDRNDAWAQLSQAQAVARAWKAKAEALEIDAIYLNSELETLRQHVALLRGHR